MKKLCSLILLLFCLVMPLQADRSDGTRFWLNADLLYFKPKEKSIVLTNKATDLFTTADVTLRHAVCPSFKWAPGCRIGFGYLLSNCAWDMVANWTHFNTHVQQRRSTHGDIGLGMFPIWSLADDILRYDWVAKAKLCWRLKLNLFDLDFGRTCSWDMFSLRPIVGLRVAAIHQDLGVRYGGGIFANGLNLADLDSTFGYDTINMKNNFWGIGPRFGLEPQFSLGGGWKLYASACGTLACGFFDVHQKETYLTAVRYQRNCSPVKFNGMLDATGGIMWKAFCRENRYAFTFAVGWEYHIFFDQVALKGDKFCLVSRDRNFVLNGVAVSARCDF